MRKIVLVILASTLLNILPFSSSSATIPKTTLARSNLWARLNQERLARRLPPLIWNGRLSEYGQAWSKKMSTKGLVHSGFTGIPQTNLYNYFGENIASGNVTTGQIHLGLMRSQGHRDNILSPGFTQGGIGVYCSGSTMWVTFEFVRKWTDGKVPNYNGGTPKLPIARSDAGKVKC